ncbi:MAG: class I SAM-dependent methyltransferase [Chitinivibrionales bacterium]|nr:class I SAM-dependent methyltransferase [Chitinivibrionales bacterium]
MALRLVKRIARAVLRRCGYAVRKADGFAAAPSPYKDALTALAANAADFRPVLDKIKAQTVFSRPELFWYPYDSLSNFEGIDRLLKVPFRNLAELAGGLPVADIGAADGDFGFYLEKSGLNNIHIIDYAPTNCNKLEGARAIKRALNSGVQIHEMDLDAAFTFPVERFGLAFLLGTFYHLKNPYYMLETLARHANYGIFAGRIARFLPDGKTDVARTPMAYLLNERECNNDVTNFWVFSPAGLQRIITRSGWDILAFMTEGCARSTPDAVEKSERAFCFAKSRFSQL